jgi:hypothetical protein
MHDISTLSHCNQKLMNEIAFHFLQVQTVSISYLRCLIEHVRCYILDRDIELVYYTIRKSSDVLTRDPMQLGAQVILNRNTIFYLYICSPHEPYSKLLHHLTVNNLHKQTNKQTILMHNLSPTHQPLSFETFTDMKKLLGKHLLLANCVVLYLS